MLLLATPVRGCGLPAPACPATLLERLRRSGVVSSSPPATTSASDCYFDYELSSEFVAEPIGIWQLAPLITGHTRFSSQPDQPRRISDRRLSRRDLFPHNRTGTHLRALPDPNTPQDLSPSPNHNPIPNHRMPAAPISLPQSHAVHNRGAVSDDSRPPDNDPRRVIEHHPAADLRPRMDVHCENLRNPALDHVGQGDPALGPEFMGQPMGLTG
ncbi:bZIP transcription factor family protein [Striga asiatica]|uniref:BZIP transcription factor family protein n=1 Tax=Striga asiatica TaxID=4170 RepID=A0A5A7R2H1_STRAF|nr:bZIP transcription factor family protein [Striga asiatica]